MFRTCAGRIRCTGNGVSALSPTLVLLVVLLTGLLVTALGVIHLCDTLLLSPFLQTRHQSEKEYLSGSGKITGAWHEPGDLTL